MSDDAVSGRRAALVLNAALQYVSAQRDFMVVLERCAIKGWPDKRDALRVAFRLQELYCEREALRLKHLENYSLDDAAWDSYTSIPRVRKRLEEEWEPNDEEALSKNCPVYVAIQKQIEQLKAGSDPVGLEGPFDMVKGDPELLAAARLFEERHRRLDRTLSIPPKPPA